MNVDAPGSMAKANRAYNRAWALWAASFGVWLCLYFNGADPRLSLSVALIEVLFAARMNWVLWLRILPMRRGFLAKH